MGAIDSPLYTLHRKQLYTGGVLKIRNKVLLKKLICDPRCRLLQFEKIVSEINLIHWTKFSVEVFAGCYEL